MDGRMDIRMDERMDGWMREFKVILHEQVQNCTHAPVLSCAISALHLITVLVSVCIRHLFV